MIELKFHVVDASGERDVSVLPVTQVAFERHFKCGIGSIADDGKVEYMYWLAWKSLGHHGEKLPEFDPWIETVQSIEALDEPQDGICRSCGQIVEVDELDPKARSLV